MVRRVERNWHETVLHARICAIELGPLTCHDTRMLKFSFPWLSCRKNLWLGCRLHETAAPKHAQCIRIIYWYIGVDAHVLRVRQRPRMHRRFMFAF